MIKLLEHTRKIVVLGLGVLVLAAASLANAQGALFDHANTGFELTGGHQFAACESCHVGGQFAGTPQTCVSCHSINGRVSATPKPIEHIYTSEQCDSCHNEAVWNAVPRVDHDEVFGTCFGCHNVNVATGKPIDHMRASNNCDGCHTNTVSWFPVRVDHEEIPDVDACFDCHNDLVTSGKPVNHIDAFNDCVGCHKNNYVAWAPVPSRNVDHDLIPRVENCARCHDNTRFAGKPVDHLPTSNQCVACHEPGLDWTMASFDHSEADNPDDCARCHGGIPNITAQSPTHIPTTQNCSACHRRPGVSFVPVDFVDHDEIQNTANNCASCHDQDRPMCAQHPQSGECDACHDPDRPWGTNDICMSM